MWERLAKKLQPFLSVKFEIEPLELKKGGRYVLVIPSEALEDQSEEVIREGLQSLVQDNPDVRLMAIVTPWLKLLEFGVEPE